MMEELPPTEPTVVCVLRSGEFRERTYSPEYVVRLKRMVARNLKTPHRFVCFTDEDIPGIDCLALRLDLPGWWSKIELFRWNAGCRLLYLDLDVLITGSLDELLDFPAPMALAPAIVTHPKPKIVRRYQTSAMVWTPPEGREIYREFRSEHMDEFRGDQDWIGHIKPDCPTFPPAWFAKITRLHGRQPPRGVKVVLCQHPMPNELAAKRHQWVQELWG